MDPRLELDETPRLARPTEAADVPLASMGWHALREVHQENESQIKRLRIKQDRSSRALAELALQLDRLEQALTLEDSDDALGEIRARLASALECLEEAGIVCYRPVGEVFEDQAVEYLESVAQRTSEDVSVPLVAEVIEPAILSSDGLLRMGKAVITVPAPVSSARAAFEEESARLLGRDRPRSSDGGSTPRSGQQGNDETR